MLKTVRSRILFFSFFSVLALLALALLSWSIIGKAENAAKDLIQNRMHEAWLLDDLEQDLRLVQDLSFKIKGQLLLWGEINEEYESLAESIPAKWSAIQRSAQLSAWAKDNQSIHEAVVVYLEELAEGIEEKSYYQAGKTVDFSLFAALSPLLESINDRKEGSRTHIAEESDELLGYLDRQQVSLIIGSVAFLAVIVLMTLWLRQTVIVRLQRIERDIQRMDECSDLANPPGLAGSDEVAGVAAALIRLVGRFEGFIKEIREASKRINEGSDRLGIQAGELESASQTTQHQIQDVTDSMKAMADQASTIEASTRDTRADGIGLENREGDRGNC